MFITLEDIGRTCVRWEIVVSMLVISVVLVIGIVMVESYMVKEHSAPNSSEEPWWLWIRCIVHPQEACCWLPLQSEGSLGCKYLPSIKNKHGDHLLSKNGAVQYNRILLAPHSCATKHLFWLKCNLTLQQPWWFSTRLESFCAWDEGGWGRWIVPPMHMKDKGGRV